MEKCGRKSTLFSEVLAETLHHRFLIFVRERACNHAIGRLPPAALQIRTKMRWRYSQTQMSQRTATTKSDSAMGA
jgi:hypothetical protein